MRDSGGAFVATMVLLVSLLTIGPASADEGRTLVLTAPGSVRLARPTPLTATLTDAAGPMVDRTVSIQRQDPSGWVEVAATHTGPDGVASAAVDTVNTSSTYRAVFADGSGEVASAPVAVTGYRVDSTLTLTGTWWVTDEHSRTLTASWRGSDASLLPGRITLQRAVAGTWRPISTQTADADGIARFVVRPRSDTRYRVTGTSGTWWNPASSSGHVLDNRPAAPPLAYPRRAPHPRPLAPQPRATGAGVHARTTRIPAGVWRSMVGRSWHRGCPVGRSALRLIRINYWGFDGYRHRGELVVHRTIARKTVRALSGMYAGRYPIRRMYRVDRFGWSRVLGGADDYRSMASDNTSAFNCRGVVGNPRVRSPHSRGRAIDLNPFENPYVSRAGIVPNRWWHYRSHPRVAWRSGSHPVMKIWRKAGFRWTYGNSDAHHYDGRLLPSSPASPGTLVG